MKGRCKGMSLWIFQSLFNYNRSPQIRTRYKYITSKGTSLYTCHKASLTVEAVIVIPLMVSFLVIFLFFFRVLQVQVAVEEALMYAGRQVAVESSVVSSEEMLFVSAEARMLAALSETPEVDEYVENGILGISLLQSEFDGREILLRAEYTIPVPVGFFGLKDIELVSENRFQKWIGNSIDNENGDGVYVTKNSEVYHSSLSCRVLDLSVKTVIFSEVENLRGLSGQKYFACSRCVETSNKSVYVYCTDYGRLYHEDIKCSALKRTVEKISIEEIGGRRQCSFCW